MQQLPWLPHTQSSTALINYFIRHKLTSLKSQFPSETRSYKATHPTKKPSDLHKSCDWYFTVSTVDFSKKRQDYRDV